MEEMILRDINDIIMKLIIWSVFERFENKSLKVSFYVISNEAIIFNNLQNKIFSLYFSC